MPNIFDFSADETPKSEYFWHATSISGMLRMISGNAGGISACGKGAMGDGFYMAGTRSDYAKGMGARWAPDPGTPCFALRIHVKNFYEKRGKLLERWDSEKTTCDFAASFYAEGGMQGVDVRVSDVKVPSLATHDAKDFAKYGQIQQKTQVVPVIVSSIKGERGQKKGRFMDKVWELAQIDMPPPDDARAWDFGEASWREMRRIGSRNFFKQGLLELTLYTDDVLAGTTVRGIKMFSPTSGPVPIKFRHDNKDYDLSGAVHQTTLPGHWSSENSARNFHSEKWADMPKLLGALGLN